MRQNKIDFAVGGQAVIEGVMMRSPKFVAIAVRKIDGSIKVKTEKFRSFSENIRIFKLPILRGMLGLIEMMIIGIRALNFSAMENLEDIEEKPVKSSKIRENCMLTFTLILSLAFGIFLFKFLPLWITDFFSTYSALIASQYVIFNIVDGVIKVTFFILYIALIALMPDIKRVFEYHGAEHKSVFNYEKKLPLRVENAKIQSRFHPRCGTSFILVVFLISIFVYTFLPPHPIFFIKFLERVALLPVIAGISYEFLRFSARYQDRAWVKVLITPGLLLQRLTTREPDEKQLEVGLKALEAVLKLEGISAAHAESRHL